MDQLNNKDGQPSLVKIRKRTYKKTPKIPSKCVVCGNISMFKYYNVQSCDGCKQFFRRTVVQQREYICQQKNDCIIDTYSKCRSCRLDQCLRTGMDPMLVEVQGSDASLDRFIEYLVERRKMLIKNDCDPPPSFFQEAISSKKPKICRKKSQIYPLDIELSRIAELTEGEPGNENFLCSQSSSASVSPSLKMKFDKSLAAYQTISTLGALDQQIKLFMHQNRHFHDGFLEQFGSLTDFLRFGERISMSNNFDKYTTLSTQSPEILYQRSAKVGNFSAKPIALMMELVAMVDLFRTMPISEALDTRDKAILLNFVCVPIVLLNGRFQSSKQRLPIVMTGNPGFSPLFFYKNNARYSGDKAIQNMVMNLYCRTMEPFNLLKVTDEEFLLLRAIMLSYPAIAALSESGRLRLQMASERYTELLMEHLRVKLGNLEGPKRFAELVQLVEFMFHTGSKQREFYTYVAMVTDQHRFHNSVPPAFIPMLLHGSE